MATVYLTEQGSVARKVGERMVVKKADRVLDDIPLVKVEAVRVVGRGITLTTPLMIYLTEKGIDTVYLSRAGRFAFRPVGRESAQAMLRTRQVQAADDTARALGLARAVVRGKLINQRFLLRRHGGQEGGVIRAMAGIEAMLKRLDGATTFDVLRGLEGQAAASYFAGFRLLLQRDLGFERRIHHPPTDPVNSLLSFGYTLLLNDLISTVHVVGLDPYIGFFHVLDYNRPSLALDLEEEFRPIIVDSLVLALVNSKAITASDFEAGDEPARPVLLNEPARRLYLRRYAERLETQVRYPATGERTSYRRLLELQTRALARALDGSQPYSPFTAQ